MEEMSVSCPFFSALIFNAPGSSGLVAVALLPRVTRYKRAVGGEHAHLMCVDTAVDRGCLFDLLADRPVGAKRMDGHGAGNVVGRQQPLSPCVHRDVDGAGADGDWRAEGGERAVGGVNSECGEVVLAIRLAERNEVAGGDVEDELCRMSPSRTGSMQVLPHWPGA